MVYGVLTTLSQKLNILLKKTNNLNLQSSIKYILNFVKYFTEGLTPEVLNDLKKLAQKVVKTN